MLMDLIVIQSQLIPYIIQNNNYCITYAQNVLARLYFDVSVCQQIIPRGILKGYSSSHDQVVLDIRQRC